VRHSAAEAAAGALHEAHGAVVVSEVGPWGDGAPGTDIDTEGDPFAAIADKYRHDTLGARTPVDTAWRRLSPLLNEVDAVVVSLPPDDTVFGWDYPALRDQLAARGIPHVCLHADPCVALSDVDRERLSTLTAAGQPVKTRHG